MAYDEQTGALTISFGDSVYVYGGVPKTVADGLNMAEAVGVSVGSFFQKYVKSKYPGKKAQ